MYSAYKILIHVLLSYKIIKSEKKSKFAFEQ